MDFSAFFYLTYILPANYIIMVGGYMKGENVLDLFIQMDEMKLKASLQDISDNYSVSTRTAKDYIRTIRNVLAEKESKDKSLIYDRDIRKYMIK